MEDSKVYCSKFIEIWKQLKYQTDLCLSHVTVEDSTVRIVYGCDMNFVTQHRANLENIFSLKRFMLSVVHKLSTSIQ